MRIPYLLLCLCAAASLLPADVRAQAAPTDGPGKRVRAVRVETPPVIDGRLDDAAWGLAEPITDFHQISPGNGTPPSERTEVYIVYTPDALYIGARMFDSEPDRIAAPTFRHNEGLGGNDRLVVILDPFSTGRTGYRFETNLNGVRHDALYESVSSFERQWTVIWDTAAAAFDRGWVAELEIPFKTLPFDPTIDTWGFNFGRGIRRRGEEMAWVSRNRSYNPSILGVMTGLAGMDQGRGLDVVPAMSMNRQTTPASSATDTNVEPTVDVFYRLTSSLNASLTVNTDFSASEVDDRQVNLTRFNLFFPEKRDFFLNDADLFEFGRIGRVGNSATSGSSNNNARPFFSRRLGLGPAGTPVDLQVGGKLSGRVGRWNIGMLAIRQDAFEDVDESTVLVGRVSANVLEESSVGAIVTVGDPTSNQGNAVVGADFRYLNTRLPGGRVLEADAWLQRSDTEGLDADDTSYGFGIGLPNNSGWQGAVYLKAVQENFNPALGFVSRSGVRDTTANVGYTYFPGGSLVQSVFAGVDAQRVSLLDGGRQSEVLLGRLLEVSTNSGEDVSVQYSLTREVVTEPFTIYEDNTREVVVPPASYSFGETQVSVSTGNQRALSGGVTWRTGDFYGGTRRNVGTSLTWRQSQYLGLDLSYDVNDIELLQGDFVTRLVSATTEVNFSSTVYWVTLIQYDNVSEVLGVNARLVWIPTAGQEVLLVLNHRMEDRDKNGTFRSTLTDLNAKLSYTFRF